MYKTKETTNLSDHSYLQFFYSGADFPTLFTIKKYQLRLNSIFETFFNPKGYYFDPKKKILYFLSLFKNMMDLNDNILNIRIAADGSKIGRNLTVLNISFSFLNAIKLPEPKSIYLYN